LVLAEPTLAVAVARTSKSSSTLAPTG